MRMRKIEADVSNINASTSQQLDAVQSKLLDLETRIINLEGPQEHCLNKTNLNTGEGPSWSARPPNCGASLQAAPPKGQRQKGGR